MFQEQKQMKKAQWKDNNKIEGVISLQKKKCSFQLASKSETTKSLPNDVDEEQTRNTNKTKPEETKDNSR